MSDNALYKFLQQGTSVERAAFTPVPPSNTPVVYVWYETDTGNTYLHDGSSWSQIAGANITNPTPAQSSFLVSGGQVVWISDYDFQVSAANYFIQGLQYSSVQTDITLDAADATNDRIDIIAVDNTGTVVKITGTASSTPSEPDVDVSTQLKLGIILVPASSSAPTVSNEILYAEYAGAPTEWNWTVSGTGFDVDSTNNPRGASTYDIEGTSVANGAYCQGEKGTGTFDPSTSNLLILYIRSKALWANNRSLAVTLRLSGVIVGTTVTIARTGSFGFNSGTLGVYQLVAIPISLFAIPTGSTINQIRITAAGAGFGFYLDDIFFQIAGASQNTGSGITQEQADARYLQRSNNLSDLASATTATSRLVTVVGDTGSGGVKGLVPAPGSGDAAAGRYLKADGNWAVPPGTGVSGINQLTGDVTAGPGDGSQAATIATNVVSNAKLAQVPTATIKGRVTASTGDLEDLTGTQAATLLPAVVGDTGSGGTKGLVPAPSAGDAAGGKYLNAGGTWTVPATEGTARVYYLDDTASDISTYYQLVTSPNSAITEQIDSISVALADGEKLIEAYAANTEFGVTVIPGGDWNFRMWRYVSNSANTSTIVIRVYKRTTGGSETELFNTTTGDINDTTNTLQNIVTTQGAFTVGATDRLVIKFFATHSTSSAKTVYYTHNGTTHYSNIVTPFASPVIDFIGDSGAGGTHGLVPAPAAGDAAAAKYLKADGTWATVTDLDTGITQLTGDVTAGPGSGSQAATLSTTGVVAGTYTKATVTVDSKGRLTAATTGSITSVAGIVIDGAGSVITTGTKGFIMVPVACTISKYTVLSIDSAATAGIIQVDVWKDTYANYPPTSADKISDTNPIALASTTKNQDVTLTGWTTSIAAGDVLAFSVSTASTVTKVLIELEVTG